MTYQKQKTRRKNDKRFIDSKKGLEEANNVMNQNNEELGLRIRIENWAEYCNHNY